MKLTPPHLININEFNQFETNFMYLIKICKLICCYFIMRYNEIRGF